MGNHAFLIGFCRIMGNVLIFMRDDRSHRLSRRKVCRRLKGYRWIIRPIHILSVLSGLAGLIEIGLVRFAGLPDFACRAV
jgi:hypothetical protein